MTAMRALVVGGPGELALRDVRAPAFAPDEVLVRSRTAAICGTDLKILHGGLPSGIVTYPCIPGHEWSGVVERVGGDVRDIEPGMRVVSEGMLRCGVCARCGAGETNLCLNYAQLGFTRGGGYGELVATPRRVVHTLPDDVSLDAAALVEPLSCVVRAFRRGRVEAGDAVGVVGVGGLGAIAILVGRLRGARAVTAFGVRAEELALARRLGADAAVDAAASAPGDELDVVVDTSGAPDAAPAAARLLRRGGRLVLVGTAGAGTVVRFGDDDLVRRELEVVGSLSYTADDWREALRMVTAHEIDLERVATHRFPIDEYVAALEMFTSRREAVGRILLRHADGGAR